MPRQELRAIFRVPSALFLALVVSSCSSSPTAPSLLGASATDSMGLVNDSRIQVAGKKPGGGGGGGTPDDAQVVMMGAIVSASQPMQVDQDNKRAYKASGLVTLTIGLSANTVNEGNCTWEGKGSGGPAWDDLAILRQALGDPALGSTYPQTRAVNFVIDHAPGGGGTGAGAIRMLAVPEGSAPWVSYAFNTGLGLATTTETVGAGGARTYSFDGSGFRAVYEGVDLVCPEQEPGPAVTVTVTPIG